MDLPVPGGPMSRIVSARPPPRSPTRADGFLAFDSAKSCRPRSRAEKFVKSTFTGAIFDFTFEKLRASRKSEPG